MSNLIERAEVIKVIDRLTAIGTFGDPISTWTLSTRNLVMDRINNLIGQSSAGAITIQGVIDKIEEFACSPCVVKDSCPVDTCIVTKLKSWLQAQAEDEDKLRQDTSSALVALEGQQKQLDSFLIGLNNHVAGMDKRLYQVENELAQIKKRKLP